MTYGNINQEVEKKGTTAMALAKNEVCVGWLHEKCYLVGRN